MPDSLDHAQQQVRQVAGPWVPPLARTGYAAKGVVYTLIGVLAVQAAFFGGGETTDTQGAVRAIGEMPFGRVLLGLTALGLWAYVTWELARAVLDAERIGTHARAVGERVVHGFKALVYGALALAAGRLALGFGGGSSGRSEQTLTAQVLAEPLGQWAVGLAGLFVIGVGLRQLHRSRQARFMENYDPDAMKERQRKAALTVGRLGLAARGVVFGIIGWFLVQAAIRSDARQTRGLETALDTLASQPYGMFLMGLTAAGLAAYGLHCFAQARFRRFEV